MATAAAPQRPLRSAPAPEVEARPDLRVVDPVDERRHRRSFGGLVGTLAVVLLFVCIFGVVVFQVLLVQTQSHLDDLERRAGHPGRPGQVARPPDRRARVARAHRRRRDRARDDRPRRRRVPPVGRRRRPADRVRPGDRTGRDRPAVGPRRLGHGHADGTTGGGTTTGTTVPSGPVLPPGPPYTAENNWGLGGPTTMPPVYTAENGWGADLATTPASGR